MDSHKDSHKDSRVAVIAIVIEDLTAAEKVNALLHEGSAYVIGRMGIPYRQKNISIISVAIDAPQPFIAELSGKIGQIPGVSVKAVYSKY